MPPAPGTCLLVVGEITAENGTENSSGYGAEHRTPESPESAGPFAAAVLEFAADLKSHKSADHGAKGSPKHAGECPLRDTWMRERSELRLENSVRFGAPVTEANA